ncbi:DUF6364 family protein [Mongoliitalea daihaiensis]|uniref:DUF6364 family protein n=1 Tax=Mongoliitalea daihaiensis TaxID=2782006 RepID=UPI00374D4AB3
MSSPYIEQAKRYAEKTGRSLSGLEKNYFRDFKGTSMPAIAPEEMIALIQK